MELPKRKHQRLQEYDYSQNGAYFVTICTQGKQIIFGKFVGNGLDRSELKLSPVGKIVKEEIEKIEKRYVGVEIEKYVVMPNHIHMIVMLNVEKETERSRPFPTLSSVVGLYKSGVTKRVHEIYPEMKIWQKSFRDHIIRNQKSYLEIWQYIDTNPLKWELDCFYKPNK